MFRKSKFDIATILDAASALKFSTKAANFSRKQLDHPDDDFVKLVGKQIYEGTLTKNVVEQIRSAIQSALEMIVRTRIQDRLSVAFADSSSSTNNSEEPSGDAKNESEIETTEEEIQAFQIVRAICAKVIDVERVTLRDAKSYCSIFVDDNNRKPLARLYFNTKSKISIGIFAKEKREEKFEISSLRNIFKYSGILEETASSYRLQFAGRGRAPVWGFRALGGA